jgi:hypothetical protein
MLKLEGAHCRHNEVYTFTSTCKTHHVQPPVAAGKPGEISLQDLPANIEFVRRRMKPKKHSKTVGFYTMVVKLAVEKMLQKQEVEEEEEAAEEVEEEVCVESLDYEGDPGGYQHVGQLNHGMPLSTCWPLVEQVFKYLADQVCDAMRL